MGRGFWGALVAAATADEPVRAGAEHDLAKFADVNALTLINAATRVRIGKLEPSDLHCSPSPDGDGSSHRRP